MVCFTSLTGKSGQFVLKDHGVLFLTIVILVLLLAAETATGSRNTPAIFAFGDGTMDTGNSNYLSNSSLRANFAPYGQSGFSSPTGRSSDGYLILDFLARYLSLPLIPPYLSRTSNFTSGASFASLGASALDSARAAQLQGTDLSLDQQLALFTDFRNRSLQSSGNGSSKQVFSDAMYTISIGTNDYLSYSTGAMGLLLTNPLAMYTTQITRSITSAIKTLYSQGARKFVVFDIGPIGCMPQVLYRSSLNPFIRPADGHCSALNILSEKHNKILQVSVKFLGRTLPNASVVLVRQSELLSNYTLNPQENGFSTGIGACCGGGPYRGAQRCGPSPRPAQSANDTYQIEICDNPSSWVWWDATNPTQAANYLVARSAIYGPQSVATPINIFQLENR